MIKPYLPAVLWLIFVTGLSVTPGVPLPKFDLFSPDKLGHVAAYGLLSGLLLWGIFRSKKRLPNWKEGLLIFSLSTGYGILIEFVQGAFIPGRFYEVDDMIANAAGAALAWGASYLLLRKIVHRKS
jgi:VanZ family protein